MNSYLGRLGILAFLGVSAFAAQTHAVLLLDPGHNPSKGGALSVRGIEEVHYNDRFAQVLGDTLQKHKVSFTRTRQPQEEKTLSERADFSQADSIWALIALHHDSAQLKYLKTQKKDQTIVYSTTQPIQGYSLFVSRLNPYFKESYAMAQSIARELLKLGRKPTLHHAEKIEGENRPLLDSTLGIYEFNELKVLKSAYKPALLIELGVLVDSTDEAYISHPKNQALMAGAIYRGLKPFLKGTSTNSK